MFRGRQQNTLAEGGAPRTVIPCHLGNAVRALRTFAPPGLVAVAALAAMPALTQVDKRPS